ncbi:MAG TPA: group III truncated hemoglobin [Arthrobacter sp.]|nr:group III truncated hemoglobin [Arthrobacter sp.]
METELPDLRNRDDVYHLVYGFYQRVFQDELLGPVFLDVAHMDLEAHMPIMCDFWETVLFRAGLYQRNALQKHVDLHDKAPLTAEHFDRWLAVWTANVDEHYAGPKAELAKVQAGRIAQSIHRRLQGRSGSQFETIGTRAAKQ